MTGPVTGSPGLPKRPSPATLSRCEPHATIRLA